MRILLDESAPRRRAERLEGHEVTSVRRMGWAGIKNGELLAKAATSFDVLVTFDRGIEFQQNLQRLPIAVLVVLARTNRMQDIMPMLDDVMSALGRIAPRTLLRVGAPSVSRRSR